MAYTEVGATAGSLGAQSLTTTGTITGGTITATDSFTTTAGFISFGSSLPSSGQIRFALNGTHIALRKSDGNNMPILASDGSNNVTIGSTTNGPASVTIATANTIVLQGAGGAINMRIGGTSIGFFNTAAASKQTVTGSRGGNAALASLLTALAAYGLITDSSSA